LSLQVQFKKKRGEIYTTDQVRHQQPGDNIKNEWLLDEGRKRVSRDSVIAELMIIIHRQETKNTLGV